MLRLAGLPFTIEPAGALRPEEAEAVARLTGSASGDRAPATDTGRTPFRLRLTEEPPWTSDDPRLFPDKAPAVVRSEAGRVRVSHHAFTAEIDPFGASGALHRRRGLAFPLEITLRVALATRLPLEGGVPLHAAGLVCPAGGVVFFGESGAGKSTLAAASPYPVLSDELVAVTGPAPYLLHGSGFWGTLGSGGAGRSGHPLAALVELDKGEVFRLERLPREAALRRLLHVTMVPTMPELWSSVLTVLGRLAADRPVYRMSWSPDAPPWDALRAALPAAPGPITA
jgi:hypothetical protein